MAMRPRGGGVGSRRGTRSGAVRSVYEDFKPVSEWQQDDESHLLNIYLPGFTKEQIRVTTEGRNTIRVRGERLVAGNKWSRFLEDFQVPDNGEMNSVRAKFHGGILSVTVPKEKHDAPLPPETTDIQKQPTPQKGQVETIPQPKGGMKQDQEDGNQKQPLPPKDKPYPDVGTIQSTEENVKASAEPDLDDGDVISQNAEKKESSETKAKHVEPEDETKDKVHKEAVGGSELPAEAKIKESGKSAATEKTVDNKDSYRASKQQDCKKVVKGITELNEERQLLVNMGVAVLVIVALTAYVTHSFASAKHKN